MSSRELERQKEVKKEKGKEIEEMFWSNCTSLECSIFETWVLKESSDSARQI